MEPVVNGLMKQYRSCLKLERVNYHRETAWHQLIGPLAAPEFALVDREKQVVHRWFGVIEASEFEAVLKPICG